MRQCDPLHRTFHDGTMGRCGHMLPLQNTCGRSTRIMNRSLTPPERRASVARGISAGFPIFVGYFPAAMAFGLIARDVSVSLPEAMLFSMVQFAGASQFFALNLIASGARTAEIITGIILVNLRHLLMSASLSRRTVERRIAGRMLIAFGNTDEVFATASSTSGPISTPYLTAMEATAWLGWVSGTFTGYTAGGILPDALQQSIGITLYGMFAALLVHNVRTIRWYIVIAAAAAAVNSVLVLALAMKPGWAFAVSMVCASALGAALLPAVTDIFKEEQFEL
jgi:predicted branched-subunit amino acid permease